MNPKISIIIPCYNTEKWVKECLASIQIQSLKEIEIFCIDDNSTDKTLSILNSIAKYDDRIKIIAKKQKEGAGPARNLGIKNATGDFIAFMDSDDFYPDSEVLKDLYNYANNNNVNICGGNIIGIDEYGNECEVRGNKFLHNKLLNYFDKPFAYSFYRFIYKRKFLVDNHLFFPCLLRYQDPPFLVKAMSIAKKYYSINKLVYDYRINIRTIEWSENKVLDAFTGIKTVLDLALSLKLDQLYIDIFVDTLFSVTYYDIYLNQHNSKKVQNLLLNIFSNANFELLDKTIKYKLSPHDKYIDLLKKEKIVWNHFKSYFSKAFYSNKNYKKVLTRIKGKKWPLNIVFIIGDNQKMVHQDLYNVFENDKRFLLILLVIQKSVLTKNEKNNIKFNEEVNYYTEKGFNITNCYINNHYLSLKQFDPDIVFYEQSEHLPEIYQPWNVSKYALTFFENNYYTGLFNIDANSLITDFYKSLFRFFVPNEEIKKLLIEKFKNFSNICECIGYSKIDKYIDKNTDTQKIWKKHSSFKIIYAPHHSFDSQYKLSTFKQNGLFLLQLAKKYPETTWIFMPNSKLQESLLKQKIMDQKEIDRYYKEWKDIGNIYTSDEYISLFKESNLLITDCCSLIAEYLFTKKPTIRLCSNNGIKLTSFGEELMSGSFQTTENSEIEMILNKLISYHDEKLERRNFLSKKFIDLKEKNFITIYKYILSIINMT